MLLVTSVLHGLVVESLSYVLPEIDNFWHGVSSVVLFKLRMPLHIFFFCECGGERDGFNFHFRPTKNTEIYSGHVHCIP